MQLYCVVRVVLGLLLIVVLLIVVSVVRIHVAASTARNGVVSYPLSLHFSAACRYRKAAQRCAHAFPRGHFMIFPYTLILKP